MKNWVPIYFLIILFSLCTSIRAMAVGSGSGNEVKDRAGLSFVVGIDATILQDVDIKDIESATDIWVTWVGEKWGVHANSIIFDDLDEMVGRFIQGELDILAMPTLSYLKHIDPIVEDLEFGPTGGYDGKAAVNYLLLARKDLKFSSFADLKGKKLSLQSKSDVERLFINTVLLRAGLREFDDFFGTIIEKKNPHGPS